MSLEGTKAALRKAAALRRRQAAAKAGPDAAAVLMEVLAGHRGVPLAGYHPVGSEIDPRPALAAAAPHGPVGLPVVEGKGLPLAFRLWTPGCAMQTGAFGVAHPAGAVPMSPEILIVPLLAFDRRGGRLGYGGGYYDRTLAGLRARGPALAIGFAYAAQELPDVPMGRHDMRLDMVVTERGVIGSAR